MKMDIYELINRPIIRNDQGEEWLNKMTDEEIEEWEAEMLEECIKAGIPYKFPDINGALLAKHIDTTVLYKIFKIANEQVR